jgi:glycosyltransferase involved in cell wall biosynthesis
LHAGLPVLARINPGNDLEAMIRDEGLGFVVAGDDATVLQRQALELADDAYLRARCGARGRDVAARCFSPEAAARQVVRGLAPIA